MQTLSRLMSPQPNSTANLPAIIGHEYSRAAADRMIARREFVWLANQMQQRAQMVLMKMLPHRNLDGSWFAPRFGSVSVVEPYYITLSLDTEALYHFSKEQYGSPRILDALSATLKFRVEVLPFDPVGGGLTYVVTLFTVQPQPAPAQIASTRLPKRVEIDLGTFPLDKLGVLIGVSAQGPVGLPLPRFGHAIIAGNTNAGKSSWEHAALAMLYARNSPRDLQTILVDPKRGILSPWKTVPQMFRVNGEPAYTYEPEEASKLLGAVVAEMNRRGDLRDKLGCQNIRGYNELVEPNERLPYLLVVIDEYLDVADQPQVVEAIKRIARRGYGDGVFVWLATQNVTAIEGLPSVVRTQLSTHIVLRLDSKDQAKALKCPDAHTISPDTPGRFYAWGIDSSATPTLMQGYFVEDQQVVALARQFSGEGTTADLPDTLKNLLAWSHREKGDRLTLELVEEWSKTQSRAMGWRERTNVLNALERDGWVERDRLNGNGRKLSAKTLAAIEK